MKLKNDEYNFKRVSLNVSNKDIEKINKLVSNSEYLNVSEFIREAIRLRLETKRGKT